MSITITSPVGWVNQVQRIHLVPIIDNELQMMKKSEVREIMFPSVELKNHLRVKMRISKQSGTAFNTSLAVFIKAGLENIINFAKCLVVAHSAAEDDKLPNYLHLFLVCKFTNATWLVPHVVVSRDDLRDPKITFAKKEDRKIGSAEYYYDENSVTYLNSMEFDYPTYFNNTISIE